MSVDRFNVPAILIAVVVICELARVWRLPWGLDYAAFLSSSPSPFLSFARAFSKFMGLRYPSVE